MSKYKKRLGIIEEIRERVNERIGKRIELSKELNFELSEDKTFEAFTFVWNKLIELEAHN